MPGPPRQTREQLERAGSWRAKFAPDPFNVPIEKPDCPDWIGPEASRHFHVIADQLVAEGILTRLDGGILAIHCLLLAHIAEFTKLLADEGIVVKGSTGQPVAHPLAGLLRDKQRMLLQTSAKLGLDPASRSGLSTRGRPPALNTDKARDKSRFIAIGRGNHGN